MNLKKIDNAPVAGESFCIETILGTYQSNRVTTVNFVNRRQLSIITLRPFFLPPKSWALLLLKSVLSVPGTLLSSRENLE